MTDKPATDEQIAAACNDALRAWGADAEHELQNPMDTTEPSFRILALITRIEQEQAQLKVAREALRKQNNWHIEHCPKGKDCKYVREAAALESEDA